MALVHCKVSFSFSVLGRMFLILNLVGTVPFLMLKKIFHSIDAEKNSCWVCYLFPQAVRALEGVTNCNWLGFISSPNRYLSLGPHLKKTRQSAAS